jgi:hypothetical protein
MQEMTNEITLQGLLKNNTLELKTDRNGRRFIAGQLEIDTGKNGEECIVPVDMLAYELKADGTKSALFDRTAEVMNYPAASTSTNNNAISVSVTRGRVQDNTFYSDRDSKVIENWKLQATFVDQATRNADRINNFSITGIIDSIKDVLNNEGEPTNELKLELLVVGYKESVMRVGLFVTQPTGIEYINKNWNVGDLVTVNGTVEYKTDVVTNTHEAAFGDPIVKTYTNTSRRLLVRSGSVPKPEDEHTYPRKKLLALLTDKNSKTIEKYNANKGASSGPAKANDKVLDF